jgi:hypothetical protein
MSIETVASYSNTFENYEESVEERRIRLHTELASITLTLHELETRHHKMTMGLIALSQTNNTHTRESITDEHTELAREIAKLRQEQGAIITETAHTNTQVWRPPYDDGRFGDGKTNKQERARIEHPLLVQIYNDSLDPTTLSHASGEGEIGHNYLPNAAL